MSGAAIMSSGQRAACRGRSGTTYAVAIEDDACDGGGSAPSQGKTRRLADAGAGRGRGGPPLPLGVRAGTAGVGRAGTASALGQRRALRWFQPVLSEGPSASNRRRERREARRGDPPAALALSLESGRGRCPPGLADRQPAMSGINNAGSLYQRSE